MKSKNKTCKVKKKNQKAVDDNICYDEYLLTDKELRTYYFTTTVVLFLVGYVFYCNLFISIGIALLSIPLKKCYLSVKIKDKKENLRQQFRDLLYSLSSSISAGRQMSEALIESKENLGLMYGEEEPIMLELKHITQSIEESRATDEVLIKDFAYRSGIEEIINFADVYSTCRSTGADVNSMISKASQVLIDKMTIEREIQTITAQKKAESKIISSMPIIIIVFLNLVSPGYLDGLYHTVLGRLVMTVALIIISISYYIMNKMVEVSI